MTIMLISMYLLGAVTGNADNGCYAYVMSVVGKKDVTEAVLISSKINQISPAVLLAYLKTENDTFENHPPNKTGDFGLFQINRKKHNYPLKTLMDIEQNAIIAGRIIRKSLEGDPTVFGLGRYHSGTPKFNRKYRPRLLRNFRRVLEMMEGYVCA